MRCPKCGYISFDHLFSCANCGRDLTELSKEFHGSTVDVKPPFFLGAALGLLGAGDEIEAAMPVAADMEEGAESDGKAADMSAVHPEPPEDDSALPGVDQGEEHEPLTLESVISDEEELPADVEQSDQISFDFDEIDFSDLVSPGTDATEQQGLEVEKPGADKKNDIGELEMASKNDDQQQGS